MNRDEYLAELLAIDAMYPWDVMPDMHEAKVEQLDRITPINVRYPSLARTSPSAGNAPAPTRKEEPVMTFTDKQEAELHRIAVQYADNPRLRDAITIRVTEAFEERNAAGPSAPADLAERIRNRAADLIATGQSVADAGRNAIRAEHVRAGLPIPTEFQSVEELRETLVAADAETDEAAAKVAQRSAELEVMSAVADEYNEANPGGISVERGNLHRQKAALTQRKVEWTQERLAALLREHPDTDFAAAAMAADHDFQSELRSFDTRIAAVNASLLAESAPAEVERPSDRA